ASGAVGEQFGGADAVDVLGEHDDRQLREPGPEGERGLDPVPGVVRRHPDVGDHQLGPPCERTGDQFRCGGGGGDDVVPLVGQQPGQALPEQALVLADDQPHGTSAYTLVPPSGAASTRSAPPIASTRSAMPRSPCPAAGSAPPRPSSETVTVISPRPSRSARRMITSAVPAPACLITLVRDSATRK